MNKLIILILTVALLVPSGAFARSTRTSSSDVYVRGHTKSNGTYVQPYYRSKADGNLLNNYSYIDKGITPALSLPSSVSSSALPSALLSPKSPQTSNSLNSSPSSYAIFDADFLKQLQSPEYNPISVPPTKQEIKAKGENELLNTERLPRISVEDDHETHIAIHAMAKQNIETIVHIRSHIRAMVIKRSRPDLFPR